MFGSRFMASSLVINMMLTILHALQCEAVMFSHPPFYPLKIIFRLLSNIFTDVFADWTGYERITTITVSQ